MSKDDGDSNGTAKEPAPQPEEAQGLLSNVEDTDRQELNSNYSPPPSVRPPRPQLQTGPKRQSSLSLPPPPGVPRAPRTTQRVRFDVPDEGESPEASRSNGHVTGSPIWLDDDDYLDGDQRSLTGQSAPLLRDITPPSASPFLSDSFQPEDHLPEARPKSNLRNAFMNMANSIIGAGIIGQPYAFNQAGMTMGIILLIALTITVDWTIRLIIINSKLSGADSFQATMQHCFGKPGLIAISVAQWAFAFGGMVAFCVIVGDTIPHVLEAVVPGLRDMPFLWLLTDRRAVIVLFVLGISWPLSLYRDIAKVRRYKRDVKSGLTGKVVSESIYFGVDQHACDHHHDYHTRRSSSERP